MVLTFKTVSWHDKWSSSTTHWKIQSLDACFQNIRLDAHLFHELLSKLLFLRCIQSWNQSTYPLCLHREYMFPQLLEPFRQFLTRWLVSASILLQPVGEMIILKQAPSKNRLLKRTFSFCKCTVNLWRNALMNGWEVLRLNHSLAKITLNVPWKKFLGRTSKLPYGIKHASSIIRLLLA